MEPTILFKAMADKTRQRTLAVLTGHELSVSELVEVLSLPQSTVSRHLKVLRSAGLIRDRRDGNAVLYCVLQQANGDPNAQLASRLLDWTAEQPLPASLDARRRAVIERRGDMSRRFFDRVGRHWDSLREEAFGKAFHLEAFIALLPEEWTVADIGTGTGYLLGTLGRRFRRVIAIDPVERMLQVARRRVEREGLSNVELDGGDLARLPLEDSDVDLALAVLVLHHVPSPQEAMRELYRIVKSPGRLLVVEQMTHNSESFRERMQDPWWGFEPARFAALLESVGFVDVRSTGLRNVECAPDAPDLFVVTGRKG